MKSSSSYTDYYSYSSPWYWVLQVFLTLYALGALAYLVLLQNVHIIDTMFPGLPGGQYFTGRYITFVWYAVMFSAAKLLLYPVVNALVLFRSSRGCSIFWFALLATLTFVHVVVIVGLGEQYGKCNESGQRGNLCNDKLWCCSPAIYEVTSNGCYNGAACASFVHPRLRPNPDFLWLFWTNFVFFLADLLLLLFFGMVFFFCPLYGGKALDKASALSDDSSDQPLEETGHQLLPDGRGKRSVDMRTLSPTRKETAKRSGK